VLASSLLSPGSTMGAEEATFASNCAVLRARAPRLAARVMAATSGVAHVLGRARDGSALLTVDGVALHHAGEPRGEGVRWARSAVDRLGASGATRAIVVGLGLGYHVEALAERFAGAIAVAEPDPATWRSALAARDLRALLARIEPLDGEEQATEPGAEAGTRVLAHAPSLLCRDGCHRALHERLLAATVSSGLRLRILVVSPIAGGSLPIARYATRALASLGHDVRLLDLSGFTGTLAQVEVFGARRQRRAEVEGALCGAIGMGVAAATEAFAPDLVLALAQAPLDARALEALGRTGAIRALWFVEDFRRFTYWREVAAQYDHVFTIQTDECMAAIGNLTDARIAYLPCAFDPDEHRPLEVTAAQRQAFGSDVSFVGAGYRNRRQAFRRLLDLDFRVWGSDWGGASELERVLQRDSARISTEDAVRIFNASKVNLNLHSSTYHDDVDPRGDFVNPRTFELAGCGAFQLVDHRQLLPDLLVPGREVVVSRSAAEMREQAAHFLARPEERRAITERARARALAEHTYAHRMQTLIGAVVAQDEERLLARSRPPTFGDLAARERGALRALLERHPSGAPFTLDAVVRGVTEHAGDVSEEEAIFLFLHQFQELYLSEASA
jgi:spore maturation protein CgeB